MRPSRAALWAVVAWLGLAVAASFWPSWVLGVQLSGAGLLVLGLTDALSLWLRPPPSVTRTLPPTMALAEAYEVELALRSPRAERLIVHDDAPQGGEVVGMPAAVRSVPGRPVRLSYRFRPLSRGSAEFRPTSVQVRGPLGLFERDLRIGSAETVEVYPNFRRVAGLVAPGEDALYRGVHLQRRRGQGLEFYQLREYRDGDSLRQIDWKSVARRQQLVSREYRSEQNQNVIFLVDCGRRMRAHDGELSLLDQSLNALLLLSYVALRQGDSVGLLTFGGPSRWLPPVRGAGGLSHVLKAIFDLDSSAEPSDFEEAVARLSARQRRRALIVVLTNLGDDDADALRDSLLPLRSKHLVLTASLRDPALLAPLAAEPLDDGEGLRALSALAYLGARRGARARLAAAGVATFESEPAALPAQLVERYMMIKRAGHL